MQLNQLNIFPIRYDIPDLVITYTLKDKTNEIDMFKIWISDVEENNLELIERATMLRYMIIVKNDNPQLKDIYIAYQYLFGKKKWKAYEELTSYVNVKTTLEKPPYNRYIEITSDYMSVKALKIYKKYLKNKIGE